MAVSTESAFSAASLAIEAICFGPSVARKSSNDGIDISPFIDSAKACEWSITYQEAPVSFFVGEKMDTKEALCRIGDKIESDAYNYRNAIESGAIVQIEEKVEDGIVRVLIEKVKR